MVVKFEIGKQYKISTLTCQELTMFFTGKSFIGKIEWPQGDRGILEILLDYDVKVLLDEKRNLEFRDHIEEFFPENECEDRQYSEMKYFIGEYAERTAGQLFFDFYMPAKWRTI